MIDLVMDKQQVIVEFKETKCEDKALTLRVQNRVGWRAVINTER